MKNHTIKTLLFILSFLCSISIYGQRQTSLIDPKYVSLVKNIKYSSPNPKEKNEYTLILSDNSMLTIRYRSVTDGEINASYTFVQTPSGYEFTNDNLSNYNYLLKNIIYWCSVLNLSQEVQKEIKNKIQASKNDFKDESFLLPLDFIKGYDEANPVFRNNYNSITCEFFFRVLL